MIESLPIYVPVTFILTTFLTVGFLLYAVKQIGFESVPAKLLTFLIFLNLIVQAFLSLNNFYQSAESFPPRIPAFGVIPAILLILFYFIFFRKNFIEILPLKILTVLSVVRIPVEIVLHWLFQNHFIPQSMTFEGRNFDIISGLSAPLIYFLAFRGGKVNRSLLIIWNIAALILLLNVVITAISAFPSINPQLPPELQSRGISYFPFIWLPAIVVPIVLFTHLASLWKLAKNKLT